MPRGGARPDIVVLPFFLVPGYFVTKSLPEHIAAAQADFPDLEFTVADAIGFDAAPGRCPDRQPPSTRSAPTSGATT